MADTIAGVPKKYAIAGVAAAGGFLAYAYWRNSQEGAPATAETPIEAAVDEYESPLGNSGGNSSGSFNGNTDPDKIDTNSEWTQSAVEFLQGSGYDASTVVNALGKYLAFKALTPNEAQIVMAARAAVGDPPVGGPYPIRDALPQTPTPTVTKKAPTGLKATTVNPTSIRIDWDWLPDVKGYIVYVNGGRMMSPVYSESTHTGLARNTVYKFSVAGIYPGDAIGPMSNTISVRTKK